MLSARKSGILLFAGFGAVALAICYGAYALTAAGWHVYMVEALAIPGAFALAGAVQAITGAPFSQLSANWNSLAGWQRGVIGLFISTLCFALLILFLVAFGKLNGLGIATP